ncbi:hypothetical protein O181_075886 [Austropuccinia psidii MF-1]|uniref:Uncharacterized protein n=1 Tax=Austropuccinia psidii MF-1 TaxID=1389203 RepID=A0A9Q3IAL3_9BASI|nr:hypothetical protein [Austropuccinia psidii MF-1]
MLANKHTRNVCSLSAPSDHVARGVLTQDALARTPLWLMMMKPYPSTNGHRDPKQANGNNSGKLALYPQLLICPPTIQWSLHSLTRAKWLSGQQRMAMARGHSSLGQLSPCLVTNGIQMPK